MNRIDRNIMVSEIKRFIRILKPEDTYSVARSIARSEIARASTALNGVVDFSTSDATPYELEITVPGEYSIGQIHFTLSIALSDGSESAFYRGFHTFRNEGGTAVMPDNVDLLPFTVAGTLAPATVVVGMTADVITITFTGIAATDIEGKIVYAVESRSLTGPVIP